MPLSPLDVAKHEFTRVMRGYDPAEVRAFLERIADELSELQTQTASLGERLRMTETKLEAYLDLEKSLRDSMVAAQDNAKIAREQIAQEREQSMREAQLSADELKLKAQRDVVAIQEELRSLKIHRDAYIKRLRFLLKSHMELLDLLEDESPDKIPDSQPFVLSRSGTENS
ncbi:DivIVA domain-containing protein [candidate division KSB1 bacterium]|nr:DivIVA domain-containing protein [candidate division KSB1 bacterium]